MKKVKWFKILISFAIMFWILIVYVALTDDPRFYFLENAHHLHNPFAKIFYMVICWLFCGFAMWFLRYGGEFVLFPFYYSYQKLRGNEKSRDIISKFIWPKTRLTLSIISWLIFASLYSIYGEQNYSCLMNSKFFVFLYGISLAIFCGVISKIYGYIGFFILSPIIYVYRKCRGKL